MGLTSKNSRSYFVLSAVAILYLGAQWLGASRMGGCRIFSLSASTDRADFAMMVNKISTTARIYCASGSPRKLLFEDGDVVMPYIVGIASPLGRCEAARITPVTPFTEAEVEDCGNLFVQEFSPPLSYHFEQGFPTDPIRTAYQWPVLNRWISEDGRFGFTIYLHPCAAPEDRKE